ncbi:MULTISPECIES: serine/threonine-protein kinase [Actinomadura]|uniref:non-specific serine/threonine protein kinase n=1 Tax=Actinomadura yumaensis TaxID=111807 RepID=A0ABW2CDJ3_9ACTN|nr:serine/threonine-protein kinase [Actinomadura sp. J1-007]MWK38253.1 protein kinase [Actinomadura sp. J1-007]
MNGGEPLAGRYRLGGELGSGAMGTVWWARDEQLGRDVAVKELKLPRQSGEARRRTAAQRALREGRAAARLRHPGIITVHDVVVADGRPWIVMELLSGRSLDRVLADEGPLEPRRAAAIGAELLDALRAAHAEGVLHRDVKPANVFQRDDGRAVLTDFGIATLADEASLTRPGALIGSPAYMAPERVRGEPGGPPSDLYSLGATLYALVEGRPPFARSAPLSMLGAVLTEEPARPRRAGPLGPLLLRLLDKDPARRPSAETVERELHAIADPGPRRPSFPRPRRRSRAAAGLVAAGLAAAVLAATVTGFAMLDDDGPARRPVAKSSLFTTVRALCGLFGADQLSGLVPAARTMPFDPKSLGGYFAEGDEPGAGRACAWDQGVKKNVSHRALIRIRPVRAATDADAVAVAYNAFARLESDARKVVYERDNAPGPRPISYVGEEAYGVDQRGEKGRLYRAIVISRTANLLLEVRYERRGPNGPFGAPPIEPIHIGAERISQWAILALRAGRPVPMVPPTPWIKPG